MESLDIGLLSTCVITTPPRRYGGTESVVADLAVALAKMGHDVTVYAVKGSKKAMDEYAGEKRLVNVVEWCEAVEDWAKKGVSEKVREVERQSFEKFRHVIARHDVVNDHTWFKPSLCLKVSGKPTCTTYHGPYIEKTGVNIDKRCAIGVSKWHADYLTRVFRVKAEWAYNPIDIRRYEFQREKEDFILFLARISPEKGALEFVKLARDLGVRGIVAGSTSVVPEDEYVSKVKELCESSNGLVKFVGEVDFTTKVDLLKRAKALVVPLSPSYWEAFGVVFVEAMACGTPVITTDRGAPREVVMHGKTGYICKPGDYEELKSVVSKLMKGEITFDPYECRRRAEEFDRIRVAKRYLELYKRVLRGEEW
ncbi:MAG: hypothetical protein DRJ68_01535 [Thermoprotei archaeon]|nr:MAG: hypothetical protein DRJ68_01535 [Thermoprotei archaeon]